MEGGYLGADPALRGGQARRVISYDGGPARRGAKLGMLAARRGQHGGRQIGGGPR